MVQPTKDTLNLWGAYFEHLEETWHSYNAFILGINIMEIGDP